MEEATFRILVVALIAIFSSLVCWVVLPLRKLLNHHSEELSRHRAELAALKERVIALASLLEKVWDFLKQDEKRGI